MQAQELWAEADSQKSRNHGIHSFTAAFTGLGADDAEREVLTSTVAAGVCDRSRTSEILLPEDWH